MRLLGRIALALLIGLAGCNREEDEDVPATKNVLSTIVATCAEIEGAVQVRRPGATYWESARQGTALRPGDWVRTGPGAGARIAFLSGGSLRLRPETVVIVSPPSPSAEGLHLAIKSGEVTGTTGGSTGAPQPLRVATDENEAGEVRMTFAEGEDVAFSLTRRKGPMDVSVNHGTAHVRGRTWFVDLSAGEAVPLTGTAPLVEKLLPFPESTLPEIDAHRRLAPGEQVSLAWNAVDDARGYRVEVARDLSFTQPLRNEDVGAKTSFSFSPGAEGLYAWRVASLDARGRPGEFGFARRFFVDLPKPAAARDLLLQPPAGTVVTANEAVFTWSPAGEKARYRLVIAHTDDLLQGAVAFDQVTAETTLTVPRLPGGEYRWGVFLEGEPATPLFTRPRRLVWGAGAARPARITAPRTIRNWGQ